MTIDEAKVILSVWRPDGSDREDPTFHEALEVTRANPQLFQWLHAQQEFDAELTESLHAVRSPTDGRLMILAQAPVILRQRWILRNFRRFGAVAALILAGAFGWQQVFLVDRVLPGSPFDLPTAAEHLSVHHKAMEILSEDAGELGNWLANRGSPIPSSLPGKISNLKSYGAQDWRTSRGRVSLLCFYPEASGGEVDYDRQNQSQGEIEWVHLFVFGDKLSRLPGVEVSPQIVEGPEWLFVVWRDVENSYALGLRATAGARDRLRALMGT